MTILYYLYLEEGTIYATLTKSLIPRSSIFVCNANLTDNSSIKDILWIANRAITSFTIELEHKLNEIENCEKLINEKKMN